MNFQKQYQRKKMTAFEATRLIKDGDRINLQASNQTTVLLLNELYKRKDALNDITVCGSLSIRNHDIFKSDCNDRIKYVSTFIGAYERNAIKNGRKIEYYCYQLKNTESVIKQRINPNVLFIMASPMDDDGYLSLSISPGEMQAFIDEAREVIVQVNDQLPCICGLKIHISKITAIVEYTEEVAVLKEEESQDIDKKVASYIVERIPDKACIQIGIGGIANAVGYCLDNHKHLGVHTEMYTESIMHLTKKGSIDNSAKQIDKGIAVFGFALGSDKMYKFLNNNPKVTTKPLSYTNDPYVIAKLDKFISVNGCISTDITGQVCSESIGNKQFSGTGGQLDFVRGAQMSKGGKSFLAMRSINIKKDGSVSSKIVFNHPEGTIITTPRTDVQYIVTEYGIADLQNESASRRVSELIKIAHPDFRDELKFRAKAEGYL